MLQEFSCVPLSEVINSLTSLYIPGNSKKLRLYLSWLYYFAVLFELMSSQDFWGFSAPKALFQIQVDFFSFSYFQSTVFTMFSSITMTNWLEKFTFLGFLISSEVNLNQKCKHIMMHNPRFHGNGTRIWTLFLKKGMKHNKKYFIKNYNFI